MELGNRCHTSAYRAAGYTAWVKKKICWVVPLAAVSKSTIIPHSDRRSGNRAGADGDALPLHSLETEVREKTEINSTKELYSFLPSANPKCIIGEEGSRYLVPRGMRTVTKHILNSSLKQASSVRIALFLTHLTLIAFQTVSS